MSSGLAEGTIFAGRYRVVRCIAAGGMGAVYEVVHLETERRRALKVMLPHILQSEDLRERFQRESKVAAHVESDYIVDVFDAGYDEATRMPFLVMELLRGEELGKRLKRVQRLSPAEVVTYLHQTALALDKTHRANIVHRDLKPENLFLTERDDGPPRIKVLDFGIAKVVADSTTLGGATQSIGTPTYMAPEQLNPNARLTGAADRYALAMVAYTLLVGAPYWGEEARGGNILALAMVVVYGPREPASARARRFGVTLPPAFDAWFSRAAHVDPAQRFASSVEMVGALAEALGTPSPARALMMSMSGVGDLLSHDPSIELPTLPTPVIAQVATPSSAPVPASSSLPAPPNTVPGMTATRPMQVPRQSKRTILAITGGVMLLTLAAAGVLVVASSRRAPLHERTSAGASTGEPSISVTPSAGVLAAPTVSAPPSATPDDTLAATASAAPAASTLPKAEPATTTTPATPASSKPTVASGRPAVSGTTPAKAPPVDPQRKKMWGRD